jgi:hypothetical protein
VLLNPSGVATPASTMFVPLDHHWSTMRLEHIKIANFCGLSR